MSDSDADDAIEPGSYIVPASAAELAECAFR